MVREFLYKSYLEDGERIHDVVHKHFFRAIPSMTRAALVGMALPAGIWLLFPELWGWMLAWGFIGLGFVKYRFFDWYYDSWVVTNVSLIQTTWNGFFNKSSRRVEYHHVMSIGFEQKGFWKTIVSMGDVAMQRGSGEMEYMRDVFSPKHKSELLSAYGDDFQTQKNARDHDSLKNLMSDMLQAHAAQKGLSNLPSSSPRRKAKI